MAKRHKCHNDGPLAVFLLLSGYPLENLVIYGECGICVFSAKSKPAGSGTAGPGRNDPVEFSFIVQLLQGRVTPVTFLLFRWPS